MPLKGQKASPAALAALNAGRGRKKKPPPPLPVILTHVEIHAAYMAGLPPESEETGTYSPSELRIVERVTRRRIVVERLDAEGKFEAASRHEDAIDKLEAELEAASAARAAKAQAEARAARINPNLMPPGERAQRAAVMYKILARSGALDAESKQIAEELGHGSQASPPPKPPTLEDREAPRPSTADWTKTVKPPPDE